MGSWTIALRVFAPVSEDTIVGGGMGECNRGEDAGAEIPVIWLCTCIHYDTWSLRQGHSAKEDSQDDRSFRRELETQGCDEAVGADAGWGTGGGESVRRRKRY
ncbi:hypothetical protein FIBSPDRAFT_873018 [Athelia psychrophila]|uniref:Uncharacterized protein n=1 Tax=Athelia psychrophila TaxID=1759441 RepID=A0A165YYV4_9AGAM|nr:hypothetical protein FIBSPDRAFT_873018 [Fibularhizoctonia sp. CBS 109695]